MITATHIVKINGALNSKGFEGKQSHSVKLTVTGKRDLTYLADRFLQDGHEQMSENVRYARKFSMTVSPEVAAKILGK